MSNIVSVGQVRNIPGKRTIVFDGTGWTTTYITTGEFDELNALANSYVDLKWHATLEEEDANTWVLTTVIPYKADDGPDVTVEVPQIQWDLKYNEVSKPLLEVDNVVVNMITDISARVIQEGLKENNESIVINGLGRLKTAGKITENERLASLNIFHHMMAGWKTWPVNVPYLVKSTVASSQWELDWTQSNIGRIYTTNSLLTNEAIDTRLINTIQTNFNQTFTNASNAVIIKAYGWYKGAPQTTATTYGRVVYNQQWTYGLWPTVISQPPI